MSFTDEIMQNTYLGLMRRYPLARDDILKVKHSKNAMTAIIIGFAFIIGGLVGHAI